MEGLHPEATSSPGPPPPAADFGEVFRAHAPYVWRVLRRLGVPERDVEDVAQEVFLVVHRSLPGFEGRSTLRTWIYGICIRVASDWRRRAHVRREVASGDVPDEGQDATQEEAVELRRRCAELDAVLDELDADKRAVVVLFEIEQLPMEEVATAVGCPVQTAYSRLYKAREQMRSAVKRRRLRGRYR